MRRETLAEFFIWTLSMGAISYGILISDSRFVGGGLAIGVICLAMDIRRAW